MGIAKKLPVDVEAGKEYLAHLDENGNATHISEAPKDLNTLDDELDEIFWRMSCYPGSEGITTTEAKARLTSLMERKKLEELKKLEPLTHEGRGTILWEMDALCTTLNARIKELESQLEKGVR